MSTLRTFNLQNPDSGTVNIEMDQGGNTLMTGIATVRGAAHFTSTSGSDAVGIGTDITAYKLDVRVTGAEAGLRVYNPDTSSNASGIIRLGNDDNQNSAFLRLNGSNNTSAVGGAANLVLGTGTAREVHLATSGTSRLRITSAGKLTVTPADTTSSYATTDGGIDIAQTISSTGTSSSQSIGIQFSLTKSGQTGAIAEIGAIREGSGLSGLVFRTRDNSTGRNERLRITSGGQMGLGTNSPNGLLALTAASGRLLTLRNSTTGSGSGDGSYLALNGSDLQIANAESANLILYTADTERLRINSLGNIGMSNDMTGGGGAYARLTVQMPTQSGGSGIQVANSSNGSGDGTTSNIVLRSVNNDCSQWAGAEYRASDHIFAIQGTEKIRINSDGRLLINATNNPTLGGQTPYLRVNGGYTNLDGLRIRGLDTGNTLWKDGGDMSITVASAHSIYFKTQSSTGLQVTANGQVLTSLQPRFLARLNANTTYNPSNFGNHLDFDTEDYDIGGNFTTSGTDQGLFTAPISGNYMFQAAAYAPGTLFTQSWFTVNSTRKAASDWVVNQSGNFVQNIQVIYLSTGDKVGFHPHKGGTSSFQVYANTHHTYFKGCLLG